MKKVVDAANVAHLWANQIQSDARTPNSNFYFNGDTLYSYGSHFVVAKHVTNESGANAVLFSTRTYSNTTSTQQGIARYAASHLNKIFVPDAGEGQTHNFNKWLNSIKEIAAKLQRARKPEIHIQAIQSLYNEAKIYAAFFGYEIPTELQTAGEITTYDQYQALTEVERIAKEKREAEQLIKKTESDKKAIAQFKKDLREWRKFTGRSAHYLRRPNVYFPTNEVTTDYLRFNADKNRVETSQRVEIPAEIAKRFYKVVLETIERGGCTDCNMMFMEHYRVTEINKDFIRVGCHKIEIKEIKALTTQLGW